MSNQSAGTNGKETVSRFLEAEAKQDVQGMADVLAEDIVF
jgi:ketosteroid isomerase-like protein